jgi:hypothetical protein
LCHGAVCRGACGRSTCASAPLPLAAALPPEAAACCGGGAVRYRTLEEMQRTPAFQSPAPHPQRCLVVRPQFARCACEGEREVWGDVLAPLAILDLRRITVLPRGGRCAWMAGAPEPTSSSLLWLRSVSSHLSSHHKHARTRAAKDLVSSKALMRCA